jgi:hypothetical protein
MKSHEEHYAKLKIIILVCPQNLPNWLFILIKKFPNERHCTPQYVLNLFINVHRWFSAGIICFLGIAFRLVKVTEREIQQ